MTWDRPKRNWYTSFDPVGQYGNVHFLVVQKEEHVAARGAQALATAYGQAMVTMKLLRPKSTPPLLGGGNIA